jgi:hypothetical protein
MSNTHEHLEHAEHAHHVAPGFDKRVAVTIAMIAAALAGVSVLGHRAHNDVLALQADANRFRTEAAAAQVEASNQFAWYQAKRLRQAQAESFLALSQNMAPAPGEDVGRHVAEVKWQKDIVKYEKELPEMETEGKKKAERAADLNKQAEDKLHESHIVHRQATRLDTGHLAVELGLVLGSIAVLTKRKAFWFAGIAAATIGLAVTASAFAMSSGHDDHAAGHQDAKPDGGHH